MLWRARAVGARRGALERAHVERLRQHQGIGHADLAVAHAQLGRPLRPSALQRSPK